MWDWFRSKQESKRILPGFDNKVTLHIYDVSGHSAITGANKFFRAIGTGAYHAGVEINGKEWSYGGSDGGILGSGIFDCDPKGCGAHHYRESQVMGYSTLTSRNELHDILRELTKEWQGDTYDLLRHNCCHFCDDFTRRIGVGPCPSWLTNLAGVGAMLRSGIRLVARAQDNAVGAIVNAPRAVGGYAIDAFGGAEGSWPSVGDTVEIYSNSHKAWYAGQVQSKDGDQVAVVFTINGSEATKVVPSNHPGLRRCITDTHRASSHARASMHGQSGKADMLHGQSEKSKNAWASEHAKEPDMCTHVAKPSFEVQYKREENRSLQVQVSEGDSVEVWSKSQNCWCAGYVERVRGNLLAFAYHLPAAGADDWSRKLMASESKDWRKTNRKLNYGVVAGDGGVEFDVGDDVEIFSNSKQMWCPGRVTKRRKDVVTVCFHSPDANMDDWVEKDVRLGDSKVLRPVNARESTDSDDLGLAYSDMEKEWYDRDFVELSANPTDRVVVSASSTADAGVVAAYLARSGLSRKALKDIWTVGNPKGSVWIDRCMFFKYCRLIGHCQTMLSKGSSDKKTFIEVGGPRLMELLRQSVNTVPHLLPDFTLEPRK